MAKYEENFKLRLSSSEKVKLIREAKRHRMTASAYLRAYINDPNARLPSPEELQLQKALIREINAVGTNINQIARNVNGHFYSESEKRKLFAMMQRLINSVEHVLDDKTGG